MKPFGKGILLTPEQSARLAMVSGLERDALIAAIAKRLHARFGIGKGKHKSTPRDWYR
jgi:hypothetical protein